MSANNKASADPPTLQPFTSNAPGRLCLFGEHQDYLHLPVIALALPLQCSIRVQPLPGSRVLTIRVPALNDAMWKYDLDDLPPRQASLGGDEAPDFALAAIYEAFDDKWTFRAGADCLSTTSIPLQAGCSSSSAFCVAWSAAIAQLCGQAPLTAIQLAQRAHRAEVTHFGAPGGAMDHVTSATGGLVRIGPDPWAVESLSGGSNYSGSWVLAYSGEPKDTLKHLHRCKHARLALLDKLGGAWDAAASDDERMATLSEDEKVLLSATLVNRDTEVQAAEAWRAGQTENLGHLMDRHHVALRDGLNLSTPKLEALRTAALQAGATGFKVVGSGGGGCGVAWIPSKDGNAEAVAQAMQNAGAPQTWIIQVPSGGASLFMDEE